ncbi:MAG: PPK2 family polyphosphate kinase, partial [Terriglobales bacterium]
MPKINDYLVPPHTKIKLSDYDPDDTGKFRSKEHADDILSKHQQKLSSLQELLYADASHGLLVVLQGLDAGGKDGTIRHIFTGVNPQGCQVTSFKQPTPEEQRHDFLWRVHRAVPERGIIGIFNRSHYEDVCVVRIHELVPKSEWSKRYELINDFEKNLRVDNETTIIKFFLYISKEEQLARFARRLDDPLRQWKIS